MNSFNSIKQNSEIIYEINKSKFIGLSYIVFDLISAKKIIDECNKKFSDATHVCYAYYIGNNEKCFDDGEPTGTAGKPILEIIKKKEIKNVLIVVVRYFGGIKLGAGGLNRAYGQTASNVINNSGIVPYKQYYIYKFMLNLGFEEKVFNNFISNLSCLKIINKVYSNYLTVDIAILEQEKENLLKSLTELVKRDDFFVFINKQFIKE